MDSWVFLMLLLAALSVLVLYWTLKGKARPRLGRHEILYAAAMAVTLHLAHVNGNADAVPWQVTVNGFQKLFAEWRGRHAEGDFSAKYHETDQEMAAYARKGNVALLLAGFDASRSLDKDFIEFLYFRGVYAIYPRRLYCEEPNAPIKSAADILKFRFSPTDQWLDAHDIATVLDYSVDEKGQLVHQARPRR